MNEHINALSALRNLTWEEALLVMGVLFSAWVSTTLVRGAVRQLAEKVSPRFRLPILRTIPILRLLVGVGAVAVITPIVIEPKFEEVIVLVASVGLALAFAFKDYASCLVASLVTVLENTYQPGDWIEVGGVYGEVKAIGARAVSIVTPDDTEVSIPHSNLWSTSIHNASSGNRSLLCVADFYLHPDHNAVLVRKRLAEIAENSPYRKPETPVTVIILEKPWGTHYRLKGYVKESREQFLFITDLTVCGKEMLRSIGIRFAQATYAEMGH